MIPQSLLSAFWPHRGQKAERRGYIQNSSGRCPCLLLTGFHPECSKLVKGELKYLLMKKVLIQALILLSIMVSQGLSHGVCGQKHSDEAYWMVVSQHAEGIVHALGIDDSSRFNRVQYIIAQQYYDLKEIQEKSKKDQLRIKYAKGSVAGKTEKLRDSQTATDKKTEKLHEDFLKTLSKEVNAGQLEEVKNRMSDGILPKAFSAYQIVIPDLTQEEKDQVYQWLVEARNHAMMAGLSEENTDWFAKYKRRINNYLSSHGYDMKKLNEEWENQFSAIQK